MFKTLTRKKSFSWRVVISICAYLLVATVARQTAVAQTCSPSGPLIVGQKRVCPIGLNESHDYTVENVEKGDFLHIEVEQRGVDVVLTLTGPNKFKLERNWPSANQGFEYLSFEAPSRGIYHLKIVVEKNSPPSPGSDYSVVLAQPKKAEAVDLSRARAEELFDQGRIQNDSKERINLLGQAVAEWRKSGDAYGLATGLTSWGFARGATQEVFTNQQELFAIYEEALRLWEAYHQRQRQIQLLMFIGRIYDFNAQLNRSVEYYKQSLTLYVKPDTPKSSELQASILNNLGTAQHRLEEDDDAIESLKAAIAALHDQGLEGREAVINNNLGQTYLDLGRLDEAEARFRQAQDIRRSPGFDREGWATTRQNQAILEVARKNLDKAESYAREALQLREKTPREFEAQHLLAYVMNLQGNAKEALSLYDHVLTFLERRPAEKAITLMNVGRIYEDQGQSDKALALYQQAVKLLPAIDSPAVEWQVLFALGRSERDHNLFEAATEHLDKAYELTLKQGRRRINLNLRSSYLANTHGVVETFVDALMHLADKRNDLSLSRKALEISEQGRSRTLIEMLKEAKVGIYRDVDPKLLEEAKDLEKQLKAADYQLQTRKFNQADPALREAAQTRVNLLTQQLESVDTKIRLAAKRFADLLTPEPFTFTQLAKTLDKNTVALEFMLGDKQSYAWLISSSGIIDAKPMPPRSEIEDLANEFHQLIRDENPKFADTGNRLRRALLDPFHDKFRNKNLLIIPDGALYYVPFAALPITNKKNTKMHFLVEEQPITILSSLSTLVTQRENLDSRPGAERALMVFADPVYDFNDPPHRCENTPRNQTSEKRNQSIPQNGNVSRGGSADVLKLPRIPQTQREMWTLLGLPFRGQKDRACGFDANIRNAEPTALAPYRYLHFAVHSEINSEQPERSGLVLSVFDENGKEVPEGVFRLRDIYRLNLQSDLVVLSACETIRGKEIRGEGIVGLTRGFMAAGARRVVTSLWRVSDRPETVQLMKLFYQGLLNSRHRKSPSVALQEAQNRMLLRNPGLHPRYWAAFTIEGEYRAIPER